MSPKLKTFHFTCLNLCNNHVDQSKNGIEIKIDPVVGVQGHPLICD